MATSFGIGAITGFLGGCYQGAFGKNNIVTSGNYAASALMGLSEGPVGLAFGLAGTLLGRTAGIPVGDAAREKASFVQEKAADVLHRVGEQLKPATAKGTELKDKAASIASPIYKKVRPYYKKVRPYITKKNCTRALITTLGCLSYGIPGLVLSGVGIYIIEFSFQPPPLIDPIYD